LQLADPYRDVLQGAAAVDAAEEVLSSARREKFLPVSARIPRKEHPNPHAPAPAATVIRLVIMSATKVSN